MTRHLENSVQPEAALPGAFTRFKHSLRLDGLRGLAILMVVLGHLAGFTFGWHIPRIAGFDTDLDQIGGLGVVVFFCLSGYLITSLIVAEQNRTGSLHLRLFYLRRLLRLYPALLAFLLILLAIRPFGLQEEIPYISWLTSLLYLRNLIGHGNITGHLWTLSMEEQFYLIWPFLLLVTPVRRLWKFVLVLIVAISVYRMIEIPLHPDQYILGIFYVRPQYRMDSILTGCLLSLLMYACPEFHFAERCRKLLRWFPIPVLATALILWTTSAAHYHVIYITGQNILTWIFVVKLIVSREVWSVRILETGVLRWFGRYSYSIYIWQQVFLVSPPKFFGILAAFPGNIIACVLIAVASHAIVEKPFLRIKDKLRP